MAQSARHLASNSLSRRPVEAWPTPTGRTAAPPARPLGLSILALAAAAIGVAQLLWAGAWFGASDIAPGTGLAAAARVIGAGLVIAAGLELVLSYGLWTVRSWAWPLGVGLGIASIALALLGAGRASSSAHLLTLTFEVGVLWYLLSPRVHELFERPARPPD
jgi:hypothetical protein